MYNLKAEKKIDTEKIVRLALLHDVHESIMGDWDDTIKEKRGMEEFRKRENEAVKEVIDKLPHALKEKYRDLWDELSEKKSVEAKLVKEMDRLECSFQAVEYSNRGLDKETLNKWLEYDDTQIEQKDLSKVLKKLMLELEKETSDIEPE
jgi:putative hydrolase of HD superfamily